MIASRALLCLVAGIGLGIGGGVALAAQPNLPKKYTETITTKTGDRISFEMVLIPAGTFKMGSPPSEAKRRDDEGPQHEVKLDAFYMCTTETTIELFLAYYRETVTQKEDALAAEDAASKAGVDAITGPTPVFGDVTMEYDKNHPAIAMTWHNANTFCKWLAKKTGKQYRLPTEAEWEYACRAGSSTAYDFGDAPEPAKLVNVAWYKLNAGHETHPVGTRKPNAFGLYDMRGNVYEWVADFYSPTAYAEAAKTSPAVNPRGPKTGKVHVARGGSYNSPAEGLRSAARWYEQEWWRAGDPQIPKSRWWLPEIDVIGFRVARSLKPAAN